MKQQVVVRNTIDEKGQPCGGTVRGVGIYINWQDGPLGAQARHGMAMPCSPDDPAPEKPGHNGAFVEGVILAAIHRLAFYQSTRFKCSENAEALKHLEAALAALEKRTARRVAAGTEGTHLGK